MRLQEFFNTAGQVGIKLDQVSPEVSVVQGMLQQLGYSLGAPGIDGKYGVETAKAVAAFKKDNQLPGDGNALSGKEIQILGIAPKAATAAPALRPTMAAPSGGNWFSKWLGGLGQGMSDIIGWAAPAQGGGSLSWAPGVDNRVLPVVLDKLQKLQSQTGLSFTITSGYRDPARNRKAGGASGSMHLKGAAVDIKFTGDANTTVKVIQMASALGFGGIGVYRPGSLHLDVRPQRVGWGPNYSQSSVPGWAATAITAHEAGKLATGVV